MPNLDAGEAPPSALPLVLHQHGGGKDPRPPRKRGPVQVTRPSGNPRSFRNGGIRGPDLPALSGEGRVDPVGGDVGRDAVGAIDALELRLRFGSVLGALREGLPVGRAIPEGDLTPAGALAVVLVASDGRGIHDGVAVLFHEQIVSPFSCPCQGFIEFLKDSFYLLFRSTWQSLVILEPGRC